MSKKRKQYSASFKSKIAMAALKGDQTTSEAPWATRTLEIGKAP
ncbi:hypothetical protein [Marinobacter sp. ATCH36]|nr:hypothetical protein [Marinobacter sp. ATCH36]